MERWQKHCQPVWLDVSVLIHSVKGTRQNVNKSTDGIIIEPESISSRSGYPTCIELYK